MSNPRRLHNYTKSTLSWFFRGSKHTHGLLPQCTYVPPYAGLRWICVSFSKSSEGKGYGPTAPRPLNCFSASLCSFAIRTTGISSSLQLVGRSRNPTSVRKLRYFPTISSVTAEPADASGSPKMRASSRSVATAFLSSSSTALVCAGKSDCTK